MTRTPQHRVIRLQSIPNIRNSPRLVTIFHGLCFAYHSVDKGKVTSGELSRLTRYIRA